MLHYILLLVLDMTCRTLDLEGQLSHCKGLSCYHNLAQCFCVTQRSITLKSIVLSSSGQHLAIPASSHHGVCVQQLREGELVILF
jgi:hypothetical protein